MEKILALDFGTKRIGYAVGDDETKISFPRGIFSNNKTVFSEIEKFVKAENIKKIVMGLPLDEENEENAQALKVKKFGEMLERQLELQVEYVDEFETSNEAMAKIPFRKDRHKSTGMKDAIAAQIILERYFDQCNLGSIL